MSGRFIVFEGGEGCGKSTQAARLAVRLDAVLTREPGATPLGAMLRSLLLARTTGAVDGRAEALLMLADRAQHVADVIRPALEAGRDVVSDRFAGSTLAYQGYGRGLPIGELQGLSDWATGGLQPDLVILLDVPAVVSADRVGDERDRFEAETDEFHRRVADGFREIAAADPDRWVVIDGAPDADRVEEAVWSAIMSRWPPS